MKSRYCSLLVLLTILVGSLADTATKTRTKLELCEDAHGNCIASASLLQSIASKTNSEAMGLKIKKENLDFDKRDLNREIEGLRHRLANPSAPPLDVTLLGRSGVGIPEVNFEYTAFNDCTSLMDCLGLLEGIKSYWTEMEDMKTNYTSKINVLENEKAALIRTRNSLRQQIANRNRN